MRNDAQQQDTGSARPGLVALAPGSSSARWLRNAPHGIPISRGKLQLLGSQALDVRRMRLDGSRGRARGLILEAPELVGCTVHGPVRRGIERHLEFAHNDRGGSE